MLKAVEIDDTAQERIKEAADLERKIRLEALIGLNSDICGIEVRPITGFDVLQMQYAENKIMIGGIPDESDFAHFFWLLKPKDSKISQVKLFKTLLKKIKSVDFINEVYDYIEKTFLELPSNKPSNPEIKSYNANPNVWLSGIIDSLASEYGWSYDEILSSPLSRILQLHQYLLQRQFKGKYKVRNPLTSRASARELNKILNTNG